MSTIFQLVLMAMRLVGRRASGRVAEVSGLLAGALLFGIMGLAGFGLALWLALAQVMGALQAALIMGGAGFAGAAILLLMARARARRTLWAPGALADNPDLKPALDALSAHKGQVSIWIPIAAVALIGFFLGRGRG